jgi:uncharacterized coiled-coil protein SlyX
MELFYFGCLVCLAVLFGINDSRHKKTEAALMDAIANNAKISADIQKRLNELAEKFNELEEASPNMDAAEFEKRWQSGVESIMNYSLMAAMGGNLNG